MPSLNSIPNVLNYLPSANLLTLWDSYIYMYIKKITRLELTIHRFLIGLCVAITAIKPLIFLLSLYAYDIMMCTIFLYELKQTLYILQLVGFTVVVKFFSPLNLFFLTTLNIYECLYCGIQVFPRT
jgi:hypothetical protein